MIDAESIGRMRRSTDLIARVITILVNRVPELGAEKAASIASDICNAVVEVAKKEYD